MLNETTAAALNGLSSANVVYYTKLTQSVRLYSNFNGCFYQKQNQEKKIKEWFFFLGNVSHESLSTIK